MRRGASRAPLAVMALALAASALTAPAAVGAVFIVRHAEKQSEANEKGVPLSPAGHARAARLAAMLRDARIVAIYSTDTVRTLSTAEPLATRAKLTPQIYDAEGVGAPEKLAARISNEHPTENVLVVGHSNTVGPLVMALGCAEEVAVGRQEYDGLWIIVPASTSAGGSLPLPSTGKAAAADASLASAASPRNSPTLLRLRL
ncbi:MAG: histidine phosphatase family protein [Acidobacteriota bacterium]